MTTVAIATQNKQTGSSTMLHTLTLAFAALTLMFALLSIILGNRLSTLQAKFLAAKIATATSETASIQGMEATLKAAMDKLETSQKRLDEEKAAAEQLRRQLAGVMKDLEKAKADFASANQTISKLKSTVPVQPTPTMATPEPVISPVVAPSPATVSPQASPSPSIPQQGESSMAPPTPIPAPTDTPATIVPESSATQTPAPPAVKPDTPVVTTTLPAPGPSPPDSTPTVTEETITDSPEAPAATAAPAAD